MTELELSQYSDPEWVAEQLKLDWRERQFLTDEEATGSPDLNSKDRKGKAVAHSGGALSRFSTEAALKHLQSTGWITSVQTRKIGKDFKPERGWMRLWPLLEVMKAEMVMTLADYADLSFLRLADLLMGIPGRDHDSLGEPVPLAVSIAESWVNKVLYWFAVDRGDPAEQLLGMNELNSLPDSKIDADRTEDPHILIIDRKWLFAKAHYLPDTVGEAEVTPGEESLLPSDGWLPLTEIRSFRAANFDVTPLLGHYARQQHPSGDTFYTFQGPSWNEAQEARKRACVSMQLNLVEPLRQFAHRNRTNERES